MVQRIPGSLDDFLDRFDISFADFDDMPSLIDALDFALGRRASRAQIDATVIRLQIQKQEAVLVGEFVTRFVRRGETVVSLRDAAGRFITEGRRNIAQLLIRRGL